MSDPTPAERPRPVSLRTPEERYAHVARRMTERGNLWWDPVQVAALEKRIKFVRNQLNLGKPVAVALPLKIGEESHGNTQYWRCLIAGQPHVFAFSQICRGIISYVGPGDQPPVREVPPAVPEKAAP